MHWNMPEMVKAQRRGAARSARLPWRRVAALAAGAAAMSLAHGNFSIPAAGWLAPFLLLLGLRDGGRMRMGAGLALLVAAQAFAWRGALPFQGASYFAVTTAVALVTFLPYLVDRWLYPQLRPPLSTLVFPLALVSVEFLFSRAGFGTWGLIGYSQAGELPLLQLLSVAGLPGLAFVLGWTGSVAADVCFHGLKDEPRARTTLALAVFLAALLVAGGLRLAAGPGNQATVRIAGVTIDNDAVFRDTWGPLTYGNPLSAPQAAATRPGTLALQQALLSRTEEEVEKGASIAVWSEGAALVLDRDEPDFIAAGQRLARERGVYLFMAMATMSPGAPLVENKVVVIDPNGRVRDVYLKSHPTPGEMSRRGDGRIGWMDTPHGRLAWAICYDFDYPELIRQAGRVGADILIDPSWENAEMTPLHTEMATFRAIENGAALFRPVNEGLSLAVDSYGQVLARLNHFAEPGPERVLVADVPTAGAATLFPWTRDAIPWLCLAGLFLLAGKALLPGRPGAG